MSISKWLKQSWVADTNIEEVQERAKMGWPQITVIFIGMWFSMWAVTVGFTIGTMMPPLQAIAACVIGFLCTGIYMALIGVAGCKEQLPTVLLLEKFVGKPVTIIFAISTVLIYTWAVGMQADITGITIAAAVGAESPKIFSAAVAVIMVLTGIIGIEAIRKLAVFAVPLFMIVTIAVAIISFVQSGGFNAVMSKQIEATMSFGAAVSSAAGAWISFATMSPDLTRYVKTPKDVVIAAMLSMGAGVILPVIGVFLAITTGVSDIGITFSTLGLAWLGVITVFFAAWTTNDSNNYCGGIALAKLTKLDRRKATTIVAAVGIVLAYMGSGATAVIGAALGWLISAAGPVGGILITYYYVLSKYGKREVKISNWVGIVAFVSGFLLALLGDGGVWGAIPIPSFVLGIFGTAIIYFLCAKIDLAQKSA